MVGETDPGNPPPVVTKLLLRQDDGDDDVDGDGDDVVSFPDPLAF